MKLVLRDKARKMQTQPDPFKQKLYDEFEQNSFKILGVPTDRVREVLSEHGEDIDAEFDAAWDFGGANFMRLTMSFKLAALETLYHEIETGVELTSEEQLLRFKSLDIGLNEETLDSYYRQRDAQQKAVDA
jgi:glutathione peroxidase-family protein